MGNALFIVWRESVEAMLVVGILHAWLSANTEARAGLRYLWGGVAAGLALAVLLAVLLLGVQSELSGEALELFQVAMVLLAAALITHMVFWMRRHGRHLRTELEAAARRATDRANGWAIALLAAIAIGREGAETAIFLYGLALERGADGGVSLFGGAALGFAGALATFWLLSRGGRYLSWRVFFRLSEAVLLLLAASLLVGGIEKLIGLDWLPALIDPLWDSSALLDDASGAGGLVAALTGYRARPALTLLLVYLAYWALVAARLHLASRPRRPQPVPAS